MWPTVSKEEALPIVETPSGVEQRSHFYHAELQHEEVVDLESPLALRVRADALVLTFLVLGDQNAGKSTFLHAFTHQHDAHFLDLLTTLPPLGSTFVNARFLPLRSASASVPLEARYAHVRDELPFLDTDLARATVLVTQEDLRFWLDERSLGASLPASSAPYALLQFVELGGDHLDALAARALPSPAQFAVLAASRALVAEAQCSLYFVNVRSLLVPLPSRTPDGATHALQAEAVAALRARLAYLRGVVGDGHALLLVLARLDDDAALGDGARISARDPALLSVSAAPAASALLSVRAAVLALARDVAERCEGGGGAMRVLDDVLEARHLRRDGSVDYDAVLDTLAALFRHELAEVRGEEAADLLVAQWLLEAQVASAAPVSRSDLEEFLEHATALPLPAPVALQRFDAVAARLTAPPRALAMRVHVLDGMSACAFTFECAGEVRVWQSALASSSASRIAAEEADAEDAWALAWPLSCAALRDELRLKLHHARAEQWLSAKQQEQDPLALAPAVLKAAQSELALHVEAMWTAYLETENAGDDTADVAWLRLVRALDECALVARLARAPAALPRALGVSRASWLRLTAALAASTDVAAAPNFKVALELRD